MRLIVCFLLLVSFDTCQATSNSLVPDSVSVPSRIPIFHVSAENLTSFDIGLEIGKQSKTLFNNIESRYDSYLNASISQISFDDMLRGRLPKLRKSIDLRYQKELEGVASSWSLIYDNKLGDGFLSWDEYWLLNLLPDMGVPANGVGFGVLSQLSSENSTIIGRNLNLKSTPELRGLQAITVYEYEDKAVVNIGFAGIVSVFSGFNDSGLFVSQLNASSGSSYQNSRHLKNKNNAVQAQGFILRKALETFASTREASKFISKKIIGISSSMLVADKINIQVLEQPAFGKAKIRTWDSYTRPSKLWGRKSQVAVVDCHVLTTMSNNCIRAKDSYRWDRLRSLAVFTSSEKADVQDIAKIMLDESNQYYEILSEHTVQSMIYLPSRGYLYLYVTPTEGAVGDSMNHPSYQVYYKDVIPSRLRQPRNKPYYIWWVSGLLILLILALLWVRRSMMKQEINRSEESST